MDWHVGAKRLVRQAGVSRDDLKAVFGVGTSAAVGHYLNGRRQPKPAQLKRLADFLGVRIDDFFVSEEAGLAPQQSLVNRLREQADQARDQPLGVRYDWSNPGGMDEQVLIHKVLAAERFEDLLTLASRVGIERLEQTAADDPDLSARPRLKRLLANIRRGYDQALADGGKPQ